tara:strand:- start:45 stop:833 length:789 start_codon:yes stop_codon:yes gene_type:complete
MVKIHPTAIIQKGAELDEGVEIGPYCVIGPNVVVGSSSKIKSHTVINGNTEIGKNNIFYQFSSIGEAPQDKKYSNESTKLVIGNNNTIREFCTFNRGTVQGNGLTELGNNNWIMAYVHLAHDCKVGDNTIFANNAQLAGHVVVKNWAILGGFTNVHQYCKIGDHSMIGMTTRLTQDVTPFTIVSGNPPVAHGVNIEGLRRRGFKDKDLLLIRKAYKILYKSGLTLDEAKIELKDLESKNVDSQEHIKIISNFLKEISRGIVR